MWAGTPLRPRCRAARRGTARPAAATSIVPGTAKRSVPGRWVAGGVRASREPGPGSPEPAGVAGVRGRPDLRRAGAHADARPGPSRADIVVLAMAFRLTRGRSVD